MPAVPAALSLHDGLHVPHSLLHTFVPLRISIRMAHDGSAAFLGRLADPSDLLTFHLIPTHATATDDVSARSRPTKHPADSKATTKNTSQNLAGGPEAHVSKLEDPTS